MEEVDVNIRKRLGIHACMHARMRHWHVILGTCMADLRQSAGASYWPAGVLLQSLAPTFSSFSDELMHSVACSVGVWHTKIFGWHWDFFLRSSNEESSSALQSCFELQLSYWHHFLFVKSNHSVAAGATGDSGSLCLLCGQEVKMLRVICCQYFEEHLY